MYVPRIQFGPLAKQVPPPPLSPFDKQVHVQRDQAVAAVRTNAASEALAFLAATPADAAKPLGKAGRI